MSTKFSTMLEVVIVATVNTAGQTKDNDDKSDFASLDEWYTEDANYDELADELFEKVKAAHRPE